MTVDESLKTGDVSHMPWYGVLWCEVTVSSL